MAVTTLPVALAVAQQPVHFHGAGCVVLPSDSNTQTQAQPVINNLLQCIQAASTGTGTTSSGNFCHWQCQRHHFPHHKRPSPSTTTSLRSCLHTTPPVKCRQGAGKEQARSRGSQGAGQSLGPGARPRPGRRGAAAARASQRARGQHNEHMVSAKQPSIIYKEDMYRARVERPQVEPGPSKWGPSNSSPRRAHQASWQARPRTHKQLL